MAIKIITQIIIFFYFDLVISEIIRVVVCNKLYDI